MLKIRSLTSRLARNPAPVIYLALAALVLGPALLPGYIFALDMVFVPHPPWPAGFSSIAVFAATLHVLNFLVPSWLEQKLILLAIFAGAGLGLHRLVPVRDEWARYAAGFLYAVNPFTYSRLMSGQFLVLAGYALMPWFVAALLRFVRGPGWRTAWPVGAWTLAIALVSLHYLGFAALAAGFALAMALWRDRRRPQRLARLAGWGAGLAAGVAAVGAASAGEAAKAASFGDRYFLAFRTASDPVFGQILNTLAQYGFWGDREGIYVLPKAAAPWWWAVALAILAVATLGAATAWRAHRREVALMLALLLAGLVLAQGIIGSPLSGLNRFLLAHVPLYGGYRDPGKFVGLIALALAYLYGLGADWASAHRRAPQWLGGLLVALPLVYTPTMLFGAGGQLRAADYPRDWYALNQRLNAEHSTGKVLFLPWHLYMKFEFAGRIIANPAPHFFDRPTIAGDNAEIGLIERGSGSPVSGDRATLPARLRTQGVEYVVLAKDADYKDYSWLDSQPDLRRVSDTQNLRVYKIQ
jgi:hypothetical protein